MMEKEKLDHANELEQVSFTKPFKYGTLTYKIIGLAMKVYNTLGYGFLEKVYENPLVVLLKKKGIQYEQQNELFVYFEDENVGEFYTDVYVEGKVIIELKSAENLCDKHRAQVINYFKATRNSVGLLINFGKEKLEYERFVL